MDMKPIRLCIPVLRRYDLLRRLLLSLQESTVKPTSVHIINNGQSYNNVTGAIAGTLKGVDWDVQTPRGPMGVAASWNWFLGFVGEERLITNDDIVFGPRSIERMATTPGDLVCGLGFSCFMLRDSCVEKVGQFDETISPGYAYFEDLDYKERVYEHGVKLVELGDVGLVHGDGTDGSSTWRAGTPVEIADHWRRYNLARRNFVRKWGALPEELEARRTPKKPAYAGLQERA